MSPAHRPIIDKLDSMKVELLQAVNGVKETITNAGGATGSGSGSQGGASGGTSGTRGRASGTGTGTVRFGAEDIRYKGEEERRRRETESKAMTALACAMASERIRSASPRRRRHFRHNREASKDSLMAELEGVLPGFAGGVAEPEFGNAVAVALSAPIKALGEEHLVSLQNLGEDLLDILVPEEELGPDGIADIIRLTGTVKRGTRELKTLMVQVKPTRLKFQLGAGVSGRCPGHGAGQTPGRQHTVSLRRSEAHGAGWTLDMVHPAPGRGRKRPLSPASSGR